MKNALFKIFRISIGIVLFGKISNWVFNFGDQINQILNASMFCLIGIAYIIVGFIWDNKFIKTIILTCGLFLLVMNFFAKGNIALDIFGVLCILTPMLIARFYKEVSPLTEH